MRCGSKQNTIALLLHTENCRETARLMFCRICYPTASNIRICDPKNIPINQKIGSKRIEKSLYSIPADCKSAGTIALLLHTRRHGHVRVVERSEKFDSIEKQQD